MAASFKILEYDIIDSTNTEAKRLLSRNDISEPVLLIAKEQTAGRGRQGKNFYSPSSTGLYMTLVLPMGCPVSGQVTMTTKAAVAVNKALEAYSGKSFMIKWVNDIYLNNKKCCGILCEAVNDYERMIMNYAIIGVGVNLYTEEWLPELKEVATSIYDNGRKYDEKTINPEIMQLACMISEKLIEELKSEDFLDYYKEHSLVLGMWIRYSENSVSKEGIAEDIDENGSLIVRTPDNGYVRLNSGEISVRLK